MWKALPLELSSGCGVDGVIGSGAEISGSAADMEALNSGVCCARATPDAIPSTNPKITAQLLQ